MKVQVTIGPIPAQHCKVVDVETGEMMPDVESIDLHLHANGTRIVRLTQLCRDEKEGLRIADNGTDLVRETTEPLEVASLDWYMAKG